MLLALVLLFTVLPIVEIALLVELGKSIGWAPTFLIALGTGVLGASLARAQGLATLTRIRSQVSAGDPPGDTLLDGALILVAGAVLITPGVLTDVFGFALLAPPIRAVVKSLMRRAFKGGRSATAANGGATVWTYQTGRIESGSPDAAGRVVEGEVINTEVIDIQTNSGQPDRNP